MPGAGSQPSELHGVACASAHACVAVGAIYSNTSTRPLAEIWGGRGWRLANPPMPPGGGVLESVSCVSPDVCVAVGYTLAGMPNGLGQGTLVDVWNGSSWSAQTTPPVAGQVELRSVSCTSPSDCVAVGMQNPSPLDYLIIQPLIERWNGTTWTIDQEATITTIDTTCAGNCPPPPAIALAGVACPSASACEAVGSTSGVPRHNNIRRVLEQHRLGNHADRRPRASGRSAHSRFVHNVRAMHHGRMGRPSGHVRRTVERNRLERPSVNLRTGRHSERHLVHLEFPLRDRRSPPTGQVPSSAAAGLAMERSELGSPKPSWPRQRLARIRRLPDDQRLLCRWRDKPRTGAYDIPALGPAHRTTRVVGRGGATTNAAAVCCYSAIAARLRRDERIGRWTACSPGGPCARDADGAPLGAVRAARAALRTTSSRADQRCGRTGVPSRRSGPAT